MKVLSQLCKYNSESYGMIRGEVQDKWLKLIIIIDLMNIKEIL